MTRFDLSNGRQRTVMHANITQITPGAGWKAVFAADDGTPRTQELVCWAAVHDRDETYLEGFVAVEAMTRPASDDKRFAGYQSPSGEPPLASFEKSCAHLAKTAH